MNSTSNVQRPNRLAALHRFAISITIFIILGHLVLGFEQSWAQHLVGITTAYGVELSLEQIDAWIQQRPSRFAGGWDNLVNFLLPAHIVGLAVPTMLYVNERLWPVAFAVAVAMASKAIFRAPFGQGSRHFFNGTNLGLVSALLILPGVGLVHPSSFTSGVSGIWDWMVPAAIVVAGTLLNAQLTGKMPLIAAWVGGFVLQAGLRSVLFDTSFITALLPMTGVLFLIITFYMVTDPGTSPKKPIDQVIFGGSIAAVYGILMANHVVYAMFYALAIVCGLRGLVFYGQAWVAYFKQSQFWGKTSETPSLSA